MKKTKETLESSTSSSAQPLMDAASYMENTISTGENDQLLLRTRRLDSSSSNYGERMSRTADGDGDGESSSALKRSIVAVETEVDQTLLVSSAVRQSTENLRKKTQSMTMNKLKFHELGLVGREDQVKLLQETLQRVKQLKESKELILIRGYSGTGKTALAKSLQNQVAGGAFVMGKFESSGTHGEEPQPYTGISAACREICGTLLLSSTPDTKEAAEAIRQKLVNELNANLLSLLLALIPDLEYFLGSDSYDDEHILSRRDEQLHLATMNQQQLHYVFRFFIKTICSQYRPLVMTLDDLQWADVSSLDLLETLLTDRQNEGLLLIGCYRSNEVTEAHVLSKSIRDMKEKFSKNNNRQQNDNSNSNTDSGCGFNISEIEVDNLAIEQVNQVILTLLSIDPYDEKQRTSVQQLTEVCFQRTSGNPFFLISFLIFLQSEEYLQFNYGSFKWTWDTERIQEETKSTANIVELVMSKLNQVNGDLCRLLQIAALLGFQFAKQTILLVWEKLLSNENRGDDVDELKMTNNLMQAVEQRLLEEAGADSYRWVHDKVQEAALASVSDLAQLQFNVGMILLRHLDKTTLDSQIFIVVNLLNAKDCKDEEVNLEIARLSAEATVKARALSAFKSTAKYASIGIKHLEGTNRWETHYDLSLTLYCAAVEAESILGNDDLIKRYADEVLDKGRNTLDKMPIYYVLAGCLGKKTKFAEANELCLDAIRQLNILQIPKREIVLGVKVMAGLFSTKKVLVSVDDTKLPIMTDPKQIATMRLLDILASYSFQSKHVLMVLYAAIKMVRLSLEHGICAASPSAFAQFGGLVSGVLNDLAAGVKIGEMSLSMITRLKGQANEALVIARTWGFMLGYSRPLHESSKQFLHGYSMGIKFGDTEMASWCIFNDACCSFLLGKSLRTIEEDCRIYVPHIKDLTWTEIAAATGYIWQSVLYLMGILKVENDDFGTNDSSLFHDVEGEPEFRHLVQFMFRSAAYTYTIDYSQGADFALKIGDYFRKKAPGHYSAQGEHFTQAVCLYAMARRTNQRKYKKPARAIRAMIQTWQTQGSVNSTHQLHLLDAEDASLCGKKDLASSLYRDGIKSAARKGLLHDVGLIHERYADFWLYDMRDEQQAKYHVEESLKAYSEWGGQRAVENLRSLYADFLAVPQSLTPTEFVGSSETLASSDFRD